MLSHTLSSSRPMQTPANQGGTQGEKAMGAPYEVSFFIPIKGYEPIEFSLMKSREYKQKLESDSTRGWATFGIISFEARGKASTAQDQKLEGFVHKAIQDLWRPDPSELMSLSTKGIDSAFLKVPPSACSGSSDPYFIEVYHLYDSLME
ncbi:unnamed protein product [Victoria cruziana]